MIVKKPLTEEQKKKLAEKQKPTPEQIQKAQDNLFMNILARLQNLETRS